MAFMRLPWVTWQLLPSFAVCGTLGEIRRCSMQSMNISLPDPLKKFVDGQIAHVGCVA
jgi:hypothetical protein